MGILDFLFGKKKESQQTQHDIHVEPVKPEKSIHSPVTVKVKYTVSKNDPDADVVPIEKIIPTLKCNAAGLYPHEILAMEYAGKFCVGEANFQGFWWYQYGVKDMQKLLKSLQDRGLITVGSVEDGLNLYKLDELKKVLIEHGLKVTGKKSDLITRLVNGVSSEDLQKVFPRRPYVLTEEGKDAIKYDGYVLYAHRHHYDGIDIYSLNRMIDGHTKRYRDIIWGHFNEKGLEYACENQFGMYSSLRFQMAEFVMEEGKYKHALLFLAESVYWSISGLHNGGNLDVKISAKFWFPYEHSIIRIAPGVIKKIAECHEKTGLSREELKQLLHDSISGLGSPFHVFTEDEVTEIIMLELDKNVSGLDAIYEKAKTRLKKEYPGISFKRDRIYTES